MRERNRENIYKHIRSFPLPRTKIQRQTSTLTARIYVHIVGVLDRGVRAKLLVYEALSY